MFWRDLSDTEKINPAASVSSCQRPWLNQVAGLGMYWPPFCCHCAEAACCSIANTRSPMGGSPDARRSQTFRAASLPTFFG